MIETLENARALVRMRGHRYIRKEGPNYREYAKLLEMRLNIKIKTFKLQLDNLFNGDPLLTEVANSLINDNQDLYLREIVPGLEKGLSENFLIIANRILANTAYDELFP